MAVTREDLEQNRLRAALGDSPVASSLLTEAALEASLASTLARLSSSPCECQDAWVFGYGSLIWNPMIFHTEAAPATVHGYHRGFYLYSRINRGTWDKPGLVLGLDRGGSCRGVAFRVPRDHAEHEFRVLWRREMLTGAYQPRWLPTEINGKRVFALAFVMNRAHEAYAGRLPDERVVGCLRDAVGLYGPAREYLQRTLIGLASNGLHDPYLDRLWTRLQAMDAANAPVAGEPAEQPDPYLSA
ncbi:gamma-glutamylcyclotransferase [Ralstonia insidiosa]|uniref:glutathione-specific gamma-glutamylcyclotransferase n=1 Tax=Ralstonia insidiosa TaxID=190721 RepID=A0A848P5H1_9RALS|nr:gamma-glutamylcyclotransferase [Ralstonia insidiosa]NMV40423.1 gamma-glutamylcyclotransferase [Ralstonia insidiosa]